MLSDQFNNSETSIVPNPLDSAKLLHIEDCQSTQTMTDIDPTKLHIINGKLIIPHLYIVNKLGSRNFDFALVFNKYTTKYYNKLTDHISTKRNIPVFKIKDQDIYFLTPEQAYLLIGCLNGKIEEKILDDVNNSKKTMIGSKQQQSFSEIVKIKASLINQISMYCRILKTSDS